MIFFIVIIVLLVLFLIVTGVTSESLPVLTVNHLAYVRTETTGRVFVVVVPSAIQVGVRVALTAQTVWLLEQARVQRRRTHALRAILAIVWIVHRAAFCVGLIVHELLSQLGFANFLTEPTLL